MDKRLIILHEQGFLVPEPSIFKEMIANANKWFIFSKMQQWQIKEYTLTSLKQKCRHFDKIFVIGCTGSCQNDKFRWSQCRKFRQSDNIPLSMVNICYIII